MALQRSEKFLNAMKDVREGGMSTRKAAQKWELKKSTLHDNLNGSNHQRVLGKVRAAVEEMAEKSVIKINAY